MTQREAFLFDLWGYVVIEGVLGADELQRANAAVDHHAALIQNREPGLAGSSTVLAREAGRGEFLENPLTFERPWCEPFRAMLAHPRSIDIFNEILGPGYRLDHGPGFIRMTRGTEGHQLHGSMTFDASQYHHFIDGRVQCGLCVAAWQLTEVRAGDGGFACIPGSHKANYRPPYEVLRLEEDWGCVHQVVAPAGSLVIFNEALVHGTLPWQPRGPGTALDPVQVLPRLHRLGLAAGGADCRSHPGGDGALRLPAAHGPHRAGPVDPLRSRGRRRRAGRRRGSCTAAR